MQNTYFSHRHFSIICAKSEASAKVDRYHIIKYGFVPCPSRSSRIRLNAYSARAQNMCSAHIFKLLIMYAIRNMCRTHIFKVVYKRRPHFLADACSFPDCPVLWTPRFYYLSGFVDTLLFTVCPVLWTPCFLLSVRFCGHRPYNAAQNSIILEFPTTQF